jgi:hypothetical protein
VPAPAPPAGSVFLAEVLRCMGVRELQLGIASAPVFFPQNSSIRTTVEPWVWEWSETAKKGHMRPIMKLITIMENCNHSCHEFDMRSICLIDKS